MDYFWARYYSGLMGRFGTEDPSIESGKVDDPQTWNRYAYVTNNPFRYVDPDGRERAGVIMDAEMRAYVAGKMSQEQMLANQQARGVGAAIGAIGVAAPAALAFGRAALTRLLGWGLSNPGRVQQVGEMAADALAPPGTPSFNSGIGSFARITGETMSARSAIYQSKIVGTLPDVGYVVDGVKFDGFKDGVFLEAKAGNTQFVKNGSFWFKGVDGFVSQAQRQVAAAKGGRIQWHFAEQSAADATRKLFKERKISGIEVVYTPE